MINPELIDDDNPEWTAEDFAKARPASQVLCELFSSEIATEILQPKKNGRPRSESPKIFTGIRLDAEVLNSFKATGKGWQTRMNDALKDWLKENHDLMQVNYE